MRRASGWTRRRRGQPVRLDLSRLAGSHARSRSARTVDGACCLELAVWRFVTVPGVPELELERRLQRVSGVTEDMWPDMDRVDLAVRTVNGWQWEVGVKDHAVPITIVENAPAARDVVVPNYRCAQVRPLARELPDKRVWTVSAFARHVRARANVGAR